MAEQHVDRVRGEVGEVAGAELLQTADQVFGAGAACHRELVGLVLVPPRQPVDRHGQQGGDGRVEKAEEDHGSVHRQVFHAEGGEQAGIVEEATEQEQEQPGLQHREQGHHRDVAEPPVADLMGEHGDDLRGGQPLEQGIEKDDAPEAAEPGEKGVGPGGTAGAVHGEDPAHGETLLGGVAADGRAQFALGQRCEPVEERQEQHRGDELDDQQERAHRQPADHPGRRPAGIEQQEHAGQQRPAEHHGQEHPLEGVENEGQRGGGVQAEALFDAKGRVDGERQLHRGREQGDEAGEHQAGGHRGESEAAGQGVHQVEAAGEDEGDGERQADGAAHQGQADGGPGVLLGAGVALRVVDPDELGGQFWVERAEFDEPGQQFQQGAQHENAENRDQVDVHCCAPCSRRFLTLKKVGMQYRRLSCRASRLMATGAPPHRATARNPGRKAGWPVWLGLHFAGRRGNACPHWGRTFITGETESWQS